MCGLELQRILAVKILNQQIMSVGFRKILKGFSELGQGCQL